LSIGGLGEPRTGARGVVETGGCLRQMVLKEPI